MIGGVIIGLVIMGALSYL
uniref:Uncharacterized protein n=1 Tax=Anguilla anguilla TaxID=7936 RepID=A0A0E9R268_ANGAN